jgi:hypothetical protein
VTSLSTDAEGLAAGSPCGPELDVGDSVTATLALACFAAVRRIAPASTATRSPSRSGPAADGTVRDRGTARGAADAIGR